MDFESTKNDWNNLSPSLGFAWTATRDSRTVIRGGGGIYDDVINVNPGFDDERHALGPRGTGRTNYQYTRVLNPLLNASGIPFEAPLIGTHLISILPYPARQPVTNER
jgi:hypothetical protein